MKKDKSWIMVAIIGLILLVLMQWQYIYLVIHTPPGKVFLGTVHFPPDYFNYLTNIVQGEKNFLKSTVLYTQEKIPENYLRWPFVILGRIHYLTGIGIAEIYNLANIVFLVSFLWAVYKFLKIIFPGEPEKRVLAFLFFAFSMAWPVIHFGSEGIQLSYYYQWYNIGNIFVRFGQTPHHLLGNTLLTLGFLLLVIWFEKNNQQDSRKRAVNAFLLFIFGFLSASLSPTHFVISVIASFVALILFTFSRKTLFRSGNFVPCLSFVAGGIPSLIYIYLLHKTEPYNAVAIWEVVQQLNINAKTLFLSGGLIIILAFFGVIPLWRKRGFGPIFSLVYTFISLIFYMSDIPFRMGMTNVRFWPQTVYIFLGVMGAEGIYYISGLFKKKKEFVLALILLFYFLTVTFSIYAYLRDNIKDRTNNSFFYLDKNVYQAYLYVHDNLPDKSIFIMPWVLNESFPAFTGRRVYYGDAVSHLTINSAEKTNKAMEFLDGKMTEDEISTFFERGNISYVLNFNNGQYEKYPFLKKVYSNPVVSVYKVVLNP